MAFHLFNTELAHAASDPEITGGVSSSAFIHPRGLRNVGITIPSSGNLDVDNSLIVGTPGNTIQRTANNQISIYTSGAERARIENDGNFVFFDAISETTQNSFSTSVGAGLNFDVTSGTVFLGSGSSNITGFNFINVPTNNSRSLTVSTMLLNNTSYIYGDACTVNGTLIPGGVRWAGGSIPYATTGTDILTFSIVRDNAGTTRVFGFGATNLI